jgi:hydrogenase maturation protease
MRQRILVLGVGNVLLRDEGIGVRVVARLESQYRFSDNVTLLDGGTLGLRLLDPISLADQVIVVDAVQWGGEPGTIYRLQAEELNRRVAFKESIHQLDLVDTLVYAEMIGKRPEAVVVGIEPADISPWGLDLTPEVQAGMDRLVEAVLQEIEAAGGSFEVLPESIRQRPQALPD